VKRTSATVANILERIARVVDTNRARFPVFQFLCVKNLRRATQNGRGVPILLYANPSGIRTHAARTVRRRGIDLKKIILLNKNRLFFAQSNHAAKDDQR